MTTEQNPNFTETGDQNSQGEQQLSQEFERSEGTPSWEEVDTEQNYQEEQPEEIQKDSGDQINYSQEIEENPAEIGKNPQEEEQEVLPENPRRVLSFGDYFKSN